MGGEMLLGVLIERGRVVPLGHGLTLCLLRRSWTTRTRGATKTWFHAMPAGPAMPADRAVHAVPISQELDDKDVWYRLGVEALRQGNHQIVEFSYQKTKAYERE